MVPVLLTSPLFPICPKYGFVLMTGAETMVPTYPIAATGGAQAEA